MSLLDKIILEKLVILKEEKYKLRMFQTELLLSIDSTYGVEESLQALRSISGVTIVTAIDSLFRKGEGNYISKVKIKFHPQRESITPGKYIDEILLPAIRSQAIPGVKILRKSPKIERIS
jgi:hypothetical protein